MPKKAFLAFFVVLSLLFISVQSYAEQKKITIEVNVSADESINSAIKNLLVKKLIKFPIVEITNIGNYRIHLIVAETVIDNKKVGYAISSLVMNMNNEKRGKVLRSAKLKLKNQSITEDDLIILLDTEPEKTIYHLYCGYDYRNIIEKIAQEIHDKVIEPERRKMGK